MKLRTLPPYHPDRVPLRTVPAGVIVCPVNQPDTFLLTAHSGSDLGYGMRAVVWLHGPYAGEVEQMGADLLVVIPSKLAVTNE